MPKPEFDSRGLPLMDTDEKCKALAYCLKIGDTESAVQHALDITERLRHQISFNLSIKQLRRRYDVKKNFRKWRDWTRQAKNTAAQTKAT